MTDYKMDQILKDSNLLQKIRKYFMVLTHYSKIGFENRYDMDKRASEYASNYYCKRRQDEAKIREK